MKTVGAAPAIEDDPGLVFQWERRSRARWRLVSLIALSLLAHAVGFYVLQVSYTPTGTQLPPPVQVMMARPERPDDPPEIRAQFRALSHWLAVTDPSLAIQPTPPGAGGNPGAFVQYLPSYKAAPPPFKPLDSPSAGAAAPPRPRPPGPVPILSSHGPTRAAGPSPATRVVLTGGIAPLVPIPLPAVVFALPTGAKTLSPAVFLVGARRRGRRAPPVPRNGLGRGQRGRFRARLPVPFAFPAFRQAGRRGHLGLGRVRLGPGNLPLTDVRPRF